MKKYNGKKIEAILMASHLTMRNWDMLKQDNKVNAVIGNVCLTVAIATMAYLAIR